MSMLCGKKICTDNATCNGRILHIIYTSTYLKFLHHTTYTSFTCVKFTRCQLDTRDEVSEVTTEGGIEMRLLLLYDMIVSTVELVVC